MFYSIFIELEWSFSVLEMYLFQGQENKQYFFLLLGNHLAILLNIYLSACGRLSPMNNRDRFCQQSLYGPFT